MEGSSSKKTQPAAGGKPPRPHWRRRDPADTSVYVVHPDQFRTVVQQLTGAAASSPPAAPQGANDGRTEAQQRTQAQQQHAGGGEENGSDRAKTLGQILDECMAWANADD